MTGSLSAPSGSSRRPSRPRRAIGASSTQSRGQCSSAGGGWRKGIALTAYRHTLPAHAPRSRLNPNYDSEVTARCLLDVLSAERSAEYWEWQPDGSRMSEEQAEAERTRRIEAAKRERGARGQWVPSAEDQAAGSCQLQENYLAAMSSRLLYAEARQPGGSPHRLE